MRKSNILLFSLFLFSLYNFIILFFLTPKIKAEFHSGSVLSIILENPPSTDKSILAWWKKDAVPFIKKIEEDNNEAFESITVTNYGKGFVALPHIENFFTGESDNNYRCREEIHSDKNCLYIDNVLLVDVYKKKYRIYYINGSHHEIDKKTGNIIKID